MGNLLNWNFLTAFTSVVGEVKNADITKSFELMGKGMLGIFVVMLLIYLVIVLLNRFTGSNKEK
ncbi:OadG-related small transporter subunit [Caproiciproducens sp. LBM24188]|jgi:hypothetical protein|nr:hypothetical protein [Oscillospiraceae bacterium]HHV31421.1 hypothetical protein [Clostridiales bacterium]